METLRLDKATAEKLEAIAAARGETPEAVVKTWVDQTAPAVNARAPMTPERRAKVAAWAAAVAAEYRAANPEGTRDARRLVNDLYDEDGLPKW